MARRVSSCVSLPWVHYIVIIMDDEGAVMAVLGNRRVYVDEVVFSDSYRM
jgi:hypothetical protein